MEGHSDSIIKVQSLVFDALDTVSSGDYHSALNKFESAIEKCKKLIPLYSGENLATLQSIQEKCKVHTQEIQQYIESSDDINLSESQYLSGSSIYRESDLGDTSMLLPSLKNRDIGEGDESGIDNVYWGGYLWDKVEALLGLLHPHAEQLRQNFHKEIKPEEREEITLDSSFILLPNERSGERIILNEPRKSTLNPNEKIKELEVKNAILQNQVDQLKKNNSTKKCI